MLTKRIIIDILFEIPSGKTPYIRHAFLPEAPLNFKVGDKVVYPNHGVGVIEDVRRRAIGDVETSFYSLRILSTDSTVMVPVENVAAVGLRKLLSRRESNRVLKVLRESEIATYDDWKGRFQANSDKMRTGDIRAVAEVLKSLTMLNEVKPLSYRERKMLDRARFLLISELAEATGKEAEVVETQVDDALSEGLKSIKSVEH
ncbi:MAG: CarD family transcriptional regulator [Acidobacteria bacterium]|nr:CarD family transcriptional regulator [Acidobacteriota bacterium]NIM60293.1 CarD family transcriptional regulator [Acidobacteriota bacterium]NIQ85569.1 CarD family transcriptional regulator [Acidobacteriota bacterium]NIT11282.1 CarD family transcriptional regulator [Acidobacteriota bacterium]